MRSTRSAPLRTWAIVLAGGDGVRLRSLARRVCGDERPKQYVPLLGDRTLLRQTLDRVAREIPASQTVVVVTQNHAMYLARSARAVGDCALLVQPANRGTAAGILLPVHWIFRQDPDATVAIFPSDHFVGDEARFMAQVARVAAWIGVHRDRIVLLGAKPSRAEVEYGWIERGVALEGPGDPPFSEVRRFWEKPTPERAQACLESECLWNTFVIVAKARTILGVAREAVPEIEQRLARLERFFGTEEGDRALHRAYALMPSANFSRAVLEPCATALAVAELADVGWADLGSPSRVLEILARTPCRPRWAVGLDLAGLPAGSATPPAAIACDARPANA